MAKEPTQRVITKKHLARLEKEQIQQRYLIIGTIIVVVLVVGIILYGVLDQTVLKSLRPVAKVGNETISTSDFEKQVRFSRYQMIENLKIYTSDPFYLQLAGQYVLQTANQLSSPTAMGQQVIDQLVEDRIVAQEAKKRGITVTDADVDKGLQEAFGFFENGTPTPTITVTPFATETLSALQQTLLPPTATPTNTVEPTATLTPTGEAATPTPAETATPTPAGTATVTLTPTITLTPTAYTKQGYEKSVTDFTTKLKAIGFTKEDLRSLIRYQLLRQKVYDAITKDTPTATEQVWARHILVKTEEEAKAVIDRLNKGEDFATVAKEVSTDTGSKDQGGDLGWFSKGKMVKPFEDVAFSMEVGKISEPVKSDFGYHVIQVLGHEKNRPLTADQIQQDKQTAYQNWLTEAKKSTYKVQTYEDVWSKVVPTEPAIPADIQQTILQLQQSQQQQQTLPQTTP